MQTTDAVTAPAPFQAPHLQPPHLRLTPQGTSPAVPAWPAAQGLEELWLLGLPPLGRLLEFFESSGVACEAVNRASLTERWRLANDHYIALELSEAGMANRGSHRDLDPCLLPLAQRVAAHPHYRRAFNTLPTRFGMVELDRLIIDQRHVTRNFVETRMANIGPAPDLQTLFHICMPIDAPEARVQIQKVSAHRYMFRCNSTDFRFQETALLRPEQITGYDSHGLIAGVVGVLVGFGSNFLNAVQVGNRMMLCNGYHRAVALRALGITHAPCIIQSATCVDELHLSVKSRVADDAGFYFESARPPLLRDFFDPLLIMMMPIRPRTRQIEVSFEVKDHIVSDL